MPRHPSPASSPNAASGPATPSRAIPAARRARVPALDAARAFAVVAMVLGHTLDALLAPAVRAEPLVALYWVARGFTAPLFMAVSGWAVTVAVSRAPDRGLEVVRARLPRVVLLFALGYALRWPGWGLPLLRAGDGAVWAHLLAFDALHAIAAALLASTFVLALPWSAGRRAAAFAALAAAAVALGTVPLAPPDPSALAPALPRLALAQALGGTSAFPLFPWVGYLFLGASLALVAGDGAGRRALAIGSAGAALVAAALAGGVEMGAGDPRLFAFRAGVVLVFLSALSVVPAALAERVRPLGRASLAVYVLHLPVVYGWSTHEGLAQRVGARLPLSTALATGLAVLAASLLAAQALARLPGLAAGAAARLRDGSAPAPRWTA